MALKDAGGAAQDGETWYGADANEVAFPLGGIGTGTISIGARGNLRDFEIWNEPCKGRAAVHTSPCQRKRDGRASPGCSKDASRRRTPPRTAFIPI
jgi:hypothetical protein